jgi:type IV secretory pathway TrbD component
MPKLRPPPPIPPSSRGALLLAVLAYLVIKGIVPFGRLFLYPFTLLATWVHEMGHGVAALLVGGGFDHLDVYADASGLAFTTTTHPWQEGIVAAAGLLAPPFVGAVLLAVSRGPRRARVVTAVLAVAMVLSLAIWVRSVAGCVALGLDAAVVAYFAARSTPRKRMVFAQFVGLTLAIDTVSRVDYLFSSSAMVGGVERPSDIVSVAKAFGGHYLVWGATLTAVSLALLALGLRFAWRDTPPPALK